jgi:hypothetical protein
MRKARRIVTAVGVSGLVVAGGITFGLMASANSLAASCASSGTPISCSITDADQGTTINTPSAVQALVTLDTSDNAATADQYILVTYSLYCTEGSNSGTTTNPTTNPPTAIALGTPVTVNLTLPSTTPTPDSCIVQSLTATLEAGTTAANAGTTTTGSFSMDLTYTPGSGSSSSSSTSPTTTHVSTVSGYGGKCVDDRGNSSSNKAEVIIWSCNSSDSAQGWTFSSGELKHNNKCANIQGNGGSGSKLILWSCTGASNEKWFHSSSDGEYVSAGTAHGLLCVDDPGYSKSNGTQLIVYKCHNSGNQHWSS